MRLCDTRKLPKRRPQRADQLGTELCDRCLTRIRAVVDSALDRFAESARETWTRNDKRLRRGRSGEEPVCNRVRVSDDCVGGAQPHGSGLVGLADRVAAFDGRLWVESPEWGGTLIAADIPLPE